MTTDKKKTQGQKHEEETTAELVKTLPEETANKVDPVILDKLREEIKKLPEEEMQNLIAAASIDFQDRRKFRVEAHKLWYEFYIYCRTQAADYNKQEKSGAYTPNEAFEKYLAGIEEKAAIIKENFTRLTAEEAAQ